MNKGTFFTGQPIFNQVLSCIPRQLISQISAEHKADYYCKKFTTYEHLVTLLYSVFNNCTSLREVTTGMLAWEQRINHLGIKHYPRRSTISDANTRRSEVVFEAIYLGLLKRYSHFLPDSRLDKKASRLYIFDATVVTLFHEVLKGTGLPNLSGRRKGGIKVHTLLRSDQDVPCMVRYSAATASDVQFLKQVNLPAGSVIVFDRGYADYKTYNRFAGQQISWITRLRSVSVYQVTNPRSVSESQYRQGIVRDEEVILGQAEKKTNITVKARLIVYKDPVTKKLYEFITNNLRLSPLTVAGYYQKRWQIELFFKRIKQNYPLKYFLGDSENAIKTQIWCVLIADLLLKVIKKGSACKWSYSNLASMVRLHLMTYMDLKSFLIAPEKALLNRIRYSTSSSNSPSLFPL
jgi:Domain of unknown function (DUF4372)/Transposase DDE domain